MISIPLFKRNMWVGLKLILPFLAILVMYNSVIIWMYDPELSKSLDQFQEIMPEMMAAVGMTGSTGTLIQFIQTYLYGFIMTLVPAIFTIMLVNKLVMRYVDNGSVACLLATPNSRQKIIITQLLSTMLWIFLLIVLMTIFGLVCCAVMFPGDLDIGKYLVLNGCTYLLQFAISGICVFAACLFNENKWYLAAGAGLPLLFYIIQMMANMGDELEKLKYATIFSLLPGQKIAEGEPGALVSCGILLGIGFVLYGVGSVIFVRKDLSV